MGVAAIRRIAVPLSNPSSAAGPARQWPVAPATAVPSRSFGERLGYFLGLCERLIIRHRAAATLLLAYLSFFWRLYDEAAVMVPHSGVKWPSSSGHELLNPEVREPLTRSAVLGRVRAGAVSPNGSAGSRPQRGAGLRRESSPGQEEDFDQDEDSTSILQERALAIAGSRRDPELVRQIYSALGNLHSARGDYYKMLHAMHLAIQAAKASDDSQAVHSSHVALGHLELKHYRYFAARTRFDDALHNDTGTAQERAESLGGIGWSALMQSYLEVAEVHFRSALTAAGVDPINPLLASCSARFDSIDGDRVFALSGLAITWNQQSRGVASVAAQSSLECAAAIFQGLPSELRTIRTWNALGLAWHVFGDVRAARHHYEASLKQQFVHPNGAAGDGTCSSAADVVACSQSALLLGLVDFGDGRIASGKGHVDQLLARTGGVTGEAAEWLVRFARAHSMLWVPAGDAFAVFLWSRAAPLLQTASRGDLARHLVEYSQALRKLQPPQLKEALAQLRRARGLVETMDSGSSGWTASDILALHKLLAATLREAGEAEEAVASFERVLELEKQAAALLGDERIGHNCERLMLAYANLGAARLAVAAQDVQRWRAGISDLTEAVRLSSFAVHGAAATQEEDDRMQALSASLRHARRLAHRRGIFETCPSQLDAFLVGPNCPV